MPILGLGNTSTKSGVTPQRITQDSLQSFWQFKEQKFPLP